MTKHDASPTKQSDFFVSFSGMPGHRSLTESCPSWLRRRWRSLDCLTSEPPSPAQFYLFCRSPNRHTPRPTEPTYNLIIKTLGCRCCSRLSHTERRPLHDATADSGKCNKHTHVANIDVHRSVTLTNKR
ncbi:hypothetical protein FOIG_00573 [Fusarium odoratissimum NRRL 54006]|uniref:Uncharacterized protein n=2 Tax=Fusarium oxysporum species complex TaxID=171631 RepID=X0KP92_FUSO5|nr:uncharacterized protein FOIG_00573 [Fusarium odoratissimum NRRL 54006]XP_031072595.1 uncharacterized protein FOIG_00573 [Fusarium odoratissimum NRRL 54006]EXM10505.1 hypothetical protein FOIG_00573 [Fusarium odoratissimum NRRL 54006]EXM10506.1 hypothetical protein FOIG_00573 [Fusarium odoratissimum NRRL 54006]TXC05128.1 hypothetical protein FocTR4_00001583 [Fusarium oxysporum f. sp. cubense]